AQAGLAHPKIAVNLSARQFRDKQLVDKITAILNETGLPPNFLELELTESIVMEDVDNNINTLRRIHDLGIRLSIDDFGTGYSSLSYLKRFPIHTVKIDRSFVKDIHDDSDDAAIVTAIIALAHSLKLNVVAEGVETGAHLEFLSSLKCDQAQGYFYSKPLPAAEYLKFVQNRQLTGND
ncbi:MAG: EAL domain-containing protein, partial [Pseudomonadota bacterium]